jgi:hypothetical protein
MRVFERLIVAMLVAAVLAGCATHVRGRVVDTKGRPAAGAHVKVEGMHGGMLTGEGWFSVEASTDSAGRFSAVVPEPRGDVSATSADGKRKGRAVVSKEVTIVVQ